jgi:hypothetical protein
MALQALVAHHGWLEMICRKLRFYQAKNFYF